MLLTQNRGRENRSYFTSSDLDMANTAKNGNTRMSKQQLITRLSQKALAILNNNNDTPLPRRSATKN
jgi:hypothetical protein